MSEPIENLEGGESVRIKINNLIAKTDLVEDCKDAAATSEANAETWAEGLDAAVVLLGGEKSSKGWAETAQAVYDNDIQPNLVNINKVADNEVNINKVAAIDTNVTKVADNEININKVAVIDVDVTAVAVIDTDVTAVAAIDTNVTTVAGNTVNINTVAANDANITTVANDIVDVSAVAASIVNVDTVATNIVDVNTVATNIADVNFVATATVEEVEPTATTEVEDFDNNTTADYLVRRAATTFETSQIKDDGTNAPEAPSFKIGDVAGGNYTEIEADGTIKFHGNATVFRDEEHTLIHQSKNNAAAKMVDNIAEGSLTYKDNATVADYAIMTVQLNHDRKNGAAVFPHLHWWQTTTNMPNWLLEYRWQINKGTKVTTWTPLAHTENAAAWVSGTLNQITRFGIITPTGDDVSDLLQIKLSRDVAAASTVYEDAETDPVDQDAVSLDVHIEIDTIGSRQEYTK